MATNNFYKDLPLDFTPHPVSGDVRPVVDDIAVKRAIVNLIKTPVGTRPFRPEYGSTINNYLFANEDAFTIHNIKQSIYETITKFEPRVDVLQVEPLFNDNGLELKITYRIKNRNAVTSITTLVKRAD
jgi:phage baseplate assembly protein W